MFRKILRPPFRKFNTSNKNSKEYQVDLSFFLTSIGITSLGIYYMNKNNGPEIESINWLKLKDMLKNDEKIDKIEIKGGNKAIIYPEKKNKIFHMNINDGLSLEKKIDKMNKEINIEYKHPSEMQLIITTLVPSFVFLGLFFYLTRRQSNGLTTLYKNEAKIVEEKTGIKLSDIAGLHQTKQDVIEFSDIIMNPDKYKEIGTKIPKGILMEGPPGTGKTMLAKAIADNYESSFYLMSGSDFIQPFIGTGTKKIQDLFNSVRENSPAILFIDEIDAIGKSRSNGKSIGHDERDNILNSLLVEMDGFQDNDKVLIIGATNRAETLDNALLRPGRFDRVVRFDLPNLEERKDILGVYYDKYKIDSSTNRDSLIKKLAMLTYGFNGAELSNLYNEASIIAVRNNYSTINYHHFEKAIDYILLGNEQQNIISSEEKEIIAYHEAGHALISFLLDKVPSPSKVSIVPRTKGMLGFSQSIPDKEKKLYTKEDMMQQIMVLMGGRVAEKIIFNQVTNGASDDIDKINKIARQIVTTYGMGNNIGLRKIYDDTKDSFWKKESDKLIDLVDIEINEIIDEKYNDTIELINNNRLFLEKIKEHLITHETILGEDLIKIYDNLQKIE